MDNNFFVGVPFTGCEQYLVDNPIIATREDEALAIATGAWLCGKKPLVFMQNSGLGNSVDVLTSLMKPYGIEFDLIISNRNEPEHHFYMHLLTKKIMEALNYERCRYV